MDHTSGDDDELLRTIRRMVSDEAARAPVKAPPHFPGMDGAGAGDAAPAASEPAPAPAPKPLVLGAMVRVRDDEPPAALPEEDALRRLVADVVREEMEVVLGDALAARVRQIVRRELAEFLARAGGDD